jgi:diguanylate cyclase (GGDEF)-like protein
MAPKRAVGRSTWLLPGAFLLGHVALPHLAGSGASVVSLVFLVIAPLLAGAACLARGRGPAAQGWRMLALAMALWAGGMVTNALLTLALGNTSGETSLSMLLFVIYGVPILFATASPEGEAWSVRLVDAALALALGLLFFVHSFAFATMAGADPSGEASLRLMFDIENLFIALFALVRFGVSRGRSDRDFFAALALFACLYLASAAYINHVQVNSDYGGFVDLVIDLPFLALMMVAMRGGRPGGDLRARPSPFERIVLAISPLMLPAMLLAVAAVLLRTHPAWAVTGFGMATLVYGLRNVLSHLRNLDERDRLEQLSQIDGLTGLPNRRRFDEVFQQEWLRARRVGGGLAVLMIDIDHFKQLNDTLGHPEGDRRLRDVARALAACATRSTDLVARYGGEEFVAILPSLGTEQAMQLAEIMRAGVYNLALPSPAPGGRVTVSVGLAWTSGDAAEDPALLLACADAALYDAKRAGRNTVRAKTLSD